MLSVILFLGTSLAWAKNDFEGRAFEAIASPEPPFADVEESLRMVFEEENQDARERAQGYFGVLAVDTDQPEITKSGQLLSDNLDRFLPASEYRRERREALKRALDLLLVQHQTTRESSRSMNDLEAWREARREVPWADRDASWFAWDLRRAYLRNLQREVVHRGPALAMLDGKEVIERLSSLRRELALAGLEHFFLPTDLSLTEQVWHRVGADTVEDQSEIRRVFRSSDELRDTSWADIRSETLKTSTGLRLTLSLPKHGKREVQRTSRGIVIMNSGGVLISPSNLPYVGFSQHDNTLDALSRPRFYECKFHAYVDNLLDFSIMKIERGDYAPIVVLSLLRQLLAQDLLGMKDPRFLRDHAKFAQITHLVRTSDNPSYFRERDARARLAKRPSLAAYMRSGARVPFLERFEGDLSKLFNLGFAKIRAMTLGAKEPLPRNKSLEESRRADRTPLWTFEGRFGLTANRIHLDTPAAADLRGPPRRHPLASGREAFAIASAVPVVPTDKLLVLPRAEGFALSSLRLRDGGRPLVEDVDFFVEVADEEDVPFVRLVGVGSVELRVGYVDRSWSFAKNVDLDSLDLRPLIPLLHRGGLIKLAGRIAREAGAVNRLSAKRLAHVVGSHSRYSYDDRLPSKPSSMARGPFAAFSGFLNARGRACFQCDGANALFAEMLRQIFAHDDRVEIREVSCLIRKPFRGIVTALGHARTHVYFMGKRVAIFDATPWILDRDRFGAEDDEDQDESSDLEAREEKADAPSILEEARSGAWTRVLAKRDALVARSSVRRDLRGGDSTTITPSAFGLVRHLGADPLHAGAQARRLRTYLDRLAANDPTMPRSPLEDDPVALSMFDELLADLERLSICEVELASTASQSSAPRSP